MSSKTTSGLQEKLLRDRFAHLEAALAEIPARNLNMREAARRANTAAANWAGFAGNDGYRRALARRDIDLAREIAALSMPEATEAIIVLQAMAAPLPADTCRVTGEISGNRPAGITVALVKQTGAALAEGTTDRVGQYVIDTRCTDTAVTLEIRDGAGRLLLQDGSPVLLQEGALIERNYIINRCGDLVEDPGEDGQQDPVMPDLIGQPVPLAERALGKLGKFALSFDHAFDKTPKGHVIAQDLAAGQPLPAGTTVTLTLSRGPEPSEKMPDLIDLTTEAARKVLADLPFKGLGIDYVDAPNSIGKVVKQEPPVDAPLGSETQILLCVGQQRKTMPDVIGKLEADARAILVPDIADTVTVNDKIAKQTPDTVIAQTPAPGTAIAPGTPIAITLARATKDTTAPRMPDVTRLTRDAATARINGLGDFKVTIKAAANTAPQGQVFGQIPAAGSPLRPGDAIKLAVSTGPAARMPKLIGLVETQARAALIPKYADAIAVTYVMSDSPGGTVTGQSPKADSTLSERNQITIEVAKADTDRRRKVLPDLAGMTAAEAKKALAVVGITQVKYDAAQARQKNHRVIAQRPASGRMLKGNETVTLTFGPKD